MTNPYTTSPQALYRRVCFRETEQLRAVLIPRFVWTDVRLWNFLLLILSFRIEYRTYQRRKAYKGRHILRATVEPSGRHAKRTPFISQVTPRRPRPIRLDATTTLG